MKALFKTPAHQQFFDQHGWLKVRMLDDAQAAELLAYYRALPTESLPEYGFHVSMDKQSKELKHQVVEELMRVIGAHAASIFQDYQVFTGSFVVKEHNPKGIVPPHQDWTFVDETRFNSLTVWTALVPTNMENGCMGVINGSHKFFDYLRASPSPQCKTPISDHAFTLFPYMQLVPMEPGEALIFDNRTIHASPPNTSGSPRIAAGIGITQQDATLLHHYLLPNQQPEKLARYEVAPTFFMDLNNGMLSKLYNEGHTPPGMQPIATLDRHLPHFSAEEILALVKSHPGNEMNVPLVERLAALFNYNADGSKKASTPEPVAAAPAPGGVKGFFKRLFG
jgi:hypothetical protein